MFADPVSGSCQAARQARQAARQSNALCSCCRCKVAALLSPTLGLPSAHCCGMQKIFFLKKQQKLRGHQQHNHYHNYNVCHRFELRMFLSFRESVE